MLYQDKINNLIPKAIEAIKEVGIAEDNVVAKEFEGYIASFGSNINQSGLLPTLIFFGNDSGKLQKSNLWLEAILYILTDGEKKDDLIPYVIEKTKRNNVNKEKYGIMDLDFDKLDRMESEILTLVSALKLAVRTYKISKEDDKFRTSI